MTERITPAEVRRWSLSVREDNIDAADFMLLVAAQMEADAAKLAALEERMKGRVLVLVRYYDWTDDPHTLYAEVVLHVSRRSGATPEKAIANLQAAIDKEGD